MGLSGGGGPAEGDTSGSEEAASGAPPVQFVPEEAESGSEPEEFVLGRDYVEEDGLVVFTAYYLLGRGKCCRLGCRNCPWGRSPAAVGERRQGGSAGTGVQVRGRADSEAAGQDER